MERWPSSPSDSPESPPDIGKKASSNSYYTIVHMDAVEKKLSLKVNEIVELFEINEEDALILLISYSWNNDKLQTKYFENMEKVKKECGIDPQQISNNPGDTCLVCLETLKPAEKDCLKCKDIFCNQCWIGYLKNAITMGKDCVLTKCPKEGCNMVVPKSMYAKYLTSEDMSAYLKFACKSFTDNNKEIKWCPAPGCKFLVENPTHALVDVICNCGKIFCSKCGEDAHMPCSCEILKAWIIKNSSDTETQRWILANTKECTKCHVRIEKNQGCNHMTCKNCHHEICWICLADWSTHGEATGGFFQCNVYKERIKTNKDLIEKEAKMALAKAETEKYQFFYDRYINHDKAMLAVIKQRGELENTIKHFCDIVNIPTGSMNFLINAADSLIGLRRCLKNSYCYGYYFPEGKDKTLFEYQQGQLEYSCENLHYLLETKLDGFINAEGLFDSKEYFKYQENLTNYFNVTKKFYKSFIDGVKENPYLLTESPKQTN